MLDKSKFATNESTNKELKMRWCWVYIDG